MPFVGGGLDIVPPPFVEQVAPNRSAEQQAVEFAVGKAKSCIELFPDALILGSDTLISLGSEVLGKPADLADAESMLRRMAGQMHKIFTAVALAGSGPGSCEVQVAGGSVTMKPLNEGGVAAYLRTGGNLGKAGGSSIPGGGGGRIEGSQGG